LGVWGLVVGVGVLGSAPQPPTPKPQSPIPNPQSPIIKLFKIYLKNKTFNLFNK